jgi:hypothetical protein
MVYSCTAGGCAACRDGCTAWCQRVLGARGTPATDDQGAVSVTGCRAWQDTALGRQPGAVRCQGALACEGREQATSAFTPARTLAALCPTVGLRGRCGGLHAVGEVCVQFGRFVWDGGPVGSLRGVAAVQGMQVPPAAWTPAATSHVQEGRCCMWVACAAVGCVLPWQGVGAGALLHEGAVGRTLWALPPQYLWCSLAWHHPLRGLAGVPPWRRRGRDVLQAEGEAGYCPVSASMIVWDRVAAYVCVNLVQGTMSGGCAGW